MSGLIHLALTALPVSIANLLLFFSSKWRHRWNPSHIYYCHLLLAPFVSLGRKRKGDQKYIECFSLMSKLRLALALYHVLLLRKLVNGF
jgi:hypothetical protein